MRVIHPRGTILRVRGVLDLRETNAKTRPVVLVRDLGEDDEELFAVAVTTTFDLPIAPPCVRLEYGPPGRCRTGLDEPAVAHGHWFVVRPVSAIVERLGFAGDSALEQAVAIIRQKVIEGR
ncbi:MAG: hypothetical protein K2W96_02465, partial [Gemmataceae bacterium]|nr:hypothetical protein [Gemmataceae bacterium]